jgi:beta-glucosidase
MGGVAKYASTEEIAVKAIQAGADILLMPENPEVAIKSIEEAIHQGILSEERIDRSLARIQQAKQKLFTSEDRIKPFAIDVISTPEAQQTVKEISRQSIRQGGDLPLKNSSGGINLVVVHDLLNCDYLDRQSPAITIPEYFNYRTQIIEQKNLHFHNPQNQPILLQIFIRGNPFLGSAGLTSAMKKFYQEILIQNAIDGLLIYGSPYVLDSLLEQLPKTTPWLFSYGQMPTAQEIIQQSLFAFLDNEKLTKGNFL